MKYTYLRILTLSILTLLIVNSCRNDDDIGAPSKIALNFAVREGFVQENNADGITIDIAFVSTTLSAGTVDIIITNGPNTTYTTDYTTAPDGASGAFTLAIASGATTASFTVIPIDISGETPAKTISFTLANPTGGVDLGNSQTYTVTIVDEPIVLITGTLVDFGDVEQNLPSPSQNYKVSGLSFTENVEATAPIGYELSDNDATFASTLSLDHAVLNGGDSITVYVRLAPTDETSLGTTSGNIAHTSEGVAEKSLAVIGNVIAPIPVITVTAALNDFGNTTIGEFSASQSYTVASNALSENVIVTAPANFEVSSDDITFGSNLSLDFNVLNGGEITVYARFIPEVGGGVGVKSGDITHASTGAATENVTVSGTAEDTPFIFIAGTSFEVPMVGASEYLDTQTNDVSHDLVNNAGEDPVDFTSAGGEMGFDAVFEFTRQFNTPTLMNAVGVINDAATIVGAFTDGTQGYRLHDTEGLFTLTFDAVDISAYTTVRINLDMYLNETSYEVSSYVGGTVMVSDKIRIYAIVDGGAEIDLFNEHSDATAGGVLNDDVLVLKDVWHNLTADLSGNTTATIVVEIDTNFTSEGIHLDNLVIEGHN